MSLQSMYSDFEQPYAGLRVRLGAALIDAVFLAAIAVPLHASILSTTGRLVAMLTPAIISIWLWAQFGWTPGKYFFKIRVVDARTGMRLSPFKGLLRCLGYLVSWALFLVGFIWIAFESKSRGWHDMIAGSVVVNVGSTYFPEDEFRPTEII